MAGSQQEQKTAQVRVKPTAIIAEGGGIVWMTPTRAKRLRDAGAVEIIGERQELGPAEMRILAEDAEKKAASFAEDQTGPSTDYQQSSQPGAEESRSSSEEVLPSQSEAAASSPRRGRRAR